MMEEGGAGFGTPTFWSRNETKHNSGVRTCKSKADNTKGKVKKQGYLLGQTAPRANWRSQEGEAQGRGLKQDPHSMILLETVVSMGLPL